MVGHLAAEGPQGPGEERQELSGPALQCPQAALEAATAAPAPPRRLQTTEETYSWPITTIIKYFKDKENTKQTNKQT